MDVGCGPYTLPQKKRNFNFQIFYGDPGPGSMTKENAPGSNR